MFKNILLSIYKNSNILHYPKQFSIKKITDIYNKNQSGGGERVLNITYKDHIYKFQESQIDDNHFILYSLDDSDLECVSILIDTETQQAELHGISNYESCLRFTNTNVGSLLLKITLKMLKKYKDRLGIKFITLTDNSIKKCNNFDIELSSMLILFNGHTWYSKYGFRPNNNFYNNKYEKNIDIINNITITDANIIKYIKLTKNNNLIKSTKRLLKEQPNFLLKTYLYNFLSKYDKTCEYFYLFYLDLFHNIGLYNFRGHQFILEL
jgi:hypothetical protein